jgi:hypothetical protein
MAEYIERSYIRKMAMFETAYTMETETDAAVLLRMVEDAPTADVAPVVRCKDCIYTRNLYGRLVCKYGTCSGCILREDFFCANGTRKEENSDETDR